MKDTRQIESRLDKLERGLLWESELEDLRATDVILYGAEAMEEIYNTEGAESLRELLDDTELSDSEKNMISEFLERKGY